MCWCLSELEQIYRATAYGVTGDNYKNVEMIPKVIDLLEKEKRETEFFDRTTCVYSDLFAMYGLSLGGLGNLKDGEPWISKGLNHAHQIGHLYSTGMAELMYGSFFWIKGVAKNCIEHTQNSINCFEKAKADAYLGLAWMILGLGYQLQGDLDTAAEHVQKGFEIQHDLGIPTMMSWIYLSFGLIHLAADELKNARKSLESAINLSQKNNEKSGEGFAWVWLGRVIWKMDSSHKDKAEECIRKGIEILIDLKLKPYYSQGYVFLGELYSYSDQREKALEYLKKAEDNFWEMEMDYWLDLTQEAMAKL